VNVCVGTACYVRGADLILRRLEKELAITSGQTTPDGQFSLRCARCVGACGMAPVVMIGPDIHSQLKPDRLKVTLRKYR
jgi:NADH-quinone oxidoreductase subunit E/NADP-reducing hydrogenase subunit HndA